MTQPQFLDDYAFDLPEALIAQSPAERRDASRLLILDRSTGEIGHRQFADLAEYLKPEDLLVVNDTRVIPARLRGKRLPSGGHAELFLVEEREENLWEALVRPGRRLKAGARISLGDYKMTATVVEVFDNGRRLIRFESDAPFWKTVEELGEAPLPPYIRRPDGPASTDNERYQTIYATERGAVAAPTAGLHFTPELIRRLEESGIRIAHVTLHVGYGTFEPVRVSDLSQHEVAPERFTIPKKTVDAIAETRRHGGRVIAVGTTTTRTLENAALDGGFVQAGSGLTSLTVRPGYDFQVVDSLITNFHLPKSSLLVLVATFGGYAQIMKAYGEAIEHGYRFYSYGDAMLII